MDFLGFVAFRINKAEGGRFQKGSVSVSGNAFPSRVSPASTLSMVPVRLDVRRAFLHGMAVLRSRAGPCVQQVGTNGRGRQLLSPGRPQPPLGKKRQHLRIASEAAPCVEAVLLGLEWPSCSRGFRLCACGCDFFLQMTCVEMQYI